MTTDLSRELVEAERQAMLCRAATDVAERRVRKLRETAGLPVRRVLSEDRWVGPKEAASLVDRSDTTLSRDIRAGKAGEVHNGRARIRVSELYAHYATR